MVGQMSRRPLYQTLGLITTAGPRVFESPIGRCASERFFPLIIDASGWHCSERMMHVDICHQMGVVSVSPCPIRNLEKQISEQSSNAENWTFCSMLERRELGPRSEQSSNVENWTFCSIVENFDHNGCQLRLATWLEIINKAIFSYGSLSTAPFQPFK
jgi:hypothetical protein